VKFDDHTRTITLPHYPIHSTHQSLNICKHNPAKSWAGKDSFQYATMLGFHDAKSSNFKLKMQSLLIANDTINKRGD